MNDHPDPDLDDDELASAYLDGELDDPARVEVDAERLERVEHFGAAREWVATPVEPLPDEDRDRMRAEALDHIGEQVKPPRRSRLPHPGLVAAVLLAVALIGIGLIIAGVKNHPSQTNTAASAPVAAGASTKSSKVTVPDLGPFADQRALTLQLASLDNSLKVQALAAGPASDSTQRAGLQITTTSNPAAGTPAANATAGTGHTVKTTDLALERCDEVIQSTDTSLGPRTAVAAAELGGRPVLVYSNPVTTGTASASPVTRISVADAQSCAILFAIQR